MTSEHLAAAAQRLQDDGDEIAAIISEHFAALAGREGRSMTPDDCQGAPAVLLGAAYRFAKMFCGDDPAAVRGYVRLVRSHADAVEQSISSAP